MSSEKVVIPRDKPYIILEGESRRASVIQYGDSGSSLDSTTFKLYAGNFLARDITFKVKQLKNFNKGKLKSLYRINYQLKI